MSGEETINAALSFVEHVYKAESPFSGTVRFQIQDDAESVTYIKYIRVIAGSGMHIFANEASYDGAPVDCKLHVERVILLAMLTGSLDPAIALMCGQLSVDNIVVMSEFVRAFDLTENNFTNFQLSLFSAAEREGFIENGANIITHYRIEPHLQDSSKKMPLKQTLALQTLHLLASCKNIASDVDTLITKVKEKDNVKRALEDLDAKVEELQATPTYKNLQSNSVYVTLRTELERASISAAIVGNKAKVAGAEIVDKLMAVAYPPNEDAIRATVMSITVGPEDVHVSVEGEPSTDAALCKVKEVPRKQNKEEMREQKKTSLLEKLEKLKQHNKEQSEQRAQRVAACNNK